MTTSDQEEQDEKRRVVLQDADVRNRSRDGHTGTFLSHTHIDDAGGRFAQVNAAKIVGQSPAIAASYLACSPALAVQLPDEPPLGFDNPGLENPTGVSVFPPVATGDPADAPSGGSGPASSSGGLMSERAGSSLSQADQDENQ
jgi:hypothetical protein